MEAETTMCLWGCVEHPEWCMSYSLDPEGTLSPTDNPNDCVLGVTPSSEVVLVPRGDKNRRLVFAGGKEMAGYLKEVRADPTHNANPGSRRVLGKRARRSLLSSSPEKGFHLIFFSRRRPGRAAALRHAPGA